MRSLPALPALALLSVCSLSLATAPVSHAGEDLPSGFETGLEAAVAFARHFGLVEEDSLLQRVNDIGYRVASQTGHDDILFNFHILDVDDPNAFALPGGFLFVTRGMLETEISDRALAHLMGHELAHVTERHFSRSDRTSSLLSLLQTAAVVATIIALPDGRGRDPVVDSSRRVDWGDDVAGNAVTNTMVFGSVFRELLVRGYGRGLEMEADEVGRRFAVRAGYSIEGGAELLEHLHERIFEDREYGYWRTHPYFSDRVAKARAARAGAPDAPSDDEVARYRLGISERLASIAARMESEVEHRARTRDRGEPLPPPGGGGPRGGELAGPEAAERSTVLFLYRSALEANPRTASAFTIEEQLLRRRTEWQRRRPAVQRDYGPLVGEYDSLLAAIESDRARRPAALRVSLEGDDSTEADRVEQRVRAARDALAAELAGQRDASAAIVGQPGAGIEFVELFLSNYPDDELAPALRVRLAEQYRLADRADEAALLLTDRRLEPGTSQDETLARVLPEVAELTTLELVSRRRGADSLGTLAAAALAERVTELDSLEIGSRYLDRFPQGSVAEAVSEKVEALAMQRYYAARLHESLETYQDALDDYHRVLLLAPRTEAARLAREGIERVQKRGVR